MTALRLAPVEFAAALDTGAELMDARSVEANGASHIPDALSIALRDAFASWLGWLVGPGRRLVFVLDDCQDRDELVRQCLEIGHENLTAELAGGITTWRDSGRPETRTELVNDPATVEGPLLDARETSEYPAGHIPADLSGALERPLAAGQ